MKKIFFIQIPIVVAVSGKPERTLRPDRWLDIPVEAETLNEAIAAVTSTIALAVQAEINR